MNLKPCPNCGSDRLYPPAAGGVFTHCRECLFVGPRPDPDGKWWNAMARDGEAAQAPTDSIARGRRDRFAAAVLTGLLASGWPEADAVNVASENADRLIARLDATEVKR